MITKTLIKIFTRDLNKLKSEINSYTNEANMWVTTKAVTNSGGNLCLHLIGNLNTFIGANLGHTGYVRQRDLEFSAKDVPRESMISQIDEVIGIIESTLTNLTEEDLQNEFKRREGEEHMTLEFFLVHLSAHLSYHLGQINYHRRLLDN